MKKLSADLREENDDLNYFSKDCRFKTLGVSWNPNTEIFTFSSGIASYRNESTKRNLLPVTSKLFDRIGWLSPVFTVPDPMATNMDAWS